MSDTTRAASVERLESRVLFAVVDGELHRPPTVLFATGDLNGDSIPDLVSLEKHKIVHRDLAARGVKEDVYVWKIKTRLSDGAGGGLGIADDEVDMVANPMAINIVDLDGDGKPDVVVTAASDTGAASLIDFPTDGKGRLTTREAGSGIATGRRMHLPSTVNPRATIVADVDGDGKPELSVFGFEPQPISASAKKVQNHPNLVTISGLDAAKQVTTTPLPGIADYTTIASGDLTGDRADDFAITDDSTGQLLIWSPRSNKMSSVQSNPLYKGNGNSGNNPLNKGQLVGVGDMDRDGRLDLVAVAGNKVTISSVADNGKLVTRTAPGVGGNPAVLARVAVGDVTGDGVPDLVAALGDGSVYVARNTTINNSKTATVPTFNQGYRKASLPIKWMAPESLELADFDKDGALDVVARVDVPTAGNETRTEFAILLSRQTAAGDFYFERGDKPTQPQFAAADLNGDRKADLVVAAAEHVVTFDAAGIKEDVYVWKVKTFLGNGDGTFSKPVSSIRFEDVIISSLAIGDFDGDGKADLAVLTSREAGSGIATGRRQYQPLRLYTGDGRGGITDPGPNVGQRTVVVPHVFEAKGIAAADMNHDGIDDLTLSGYVRSPRDAASGQATGKRLAAFTFFSAGPGGGPHTALTLIGTASDPDQGCGDAIVPAGDLDGDGRPDLIMTARETGSGIATGKRMAILSPNPSSPAGPLSVKISNNPLYQGSGQSGENPLYKGSRLIAAGDVDGDGRPDLLAATDQGLFLSSFDPKTQSFLPPGPCKSDGTPATLLSSTCLAADLDGDGKLDLLSFTSPTDYSPAFNTSTPGSPSYSWKPHNILPG